MKHLYYGGKKWHQTPYMSKEYTVQDGPYLATAVVVPVEDKKPKKRKKGEENAEPGVTFVLMGVRVEDTRSKVGHVSRTTNTHYHLPGYTFFWKRKTGLISESEPAKIVTDRLGQPVMDNFTPVVKQPTDKESGVTAETHRLADKLVPLVGLALSAYDAWREEQRAKAA